ncbi:hypothetical protein INN71_04305 [Nocardioides sp. ChNu-153]|uniref:hypothetical protein n=1 Tax=unclassified Nocardioides TaxID=2615069 RepID=UPI0024072217|nr:MULTISPECIES: hypothetical protein [unclassified Nocardioides]MDF9715447.1 hypothetical protein [Nocardioides sp. ChNu-99]MDN7120610.1 hypothetical protein [Nocardioides sp. ChNu-153]
MGDDRVGDDQLSRAEIAKDVAQATVGIAATTVGRVVTIVTGAVRQVADAVGDGATEVFELRDAARRAAAELEPRKD